MKLLSSSFVWLRLLIATLLLLSSCSGHILPSMEPPSTLAVERKEAINHSLERVFSRSTFANTVSSFGNNTASLPRNSLERSPRLKRSTCSERPTTDEYMQYYDLKLLNRCWDDCDCRKGRYCTSHSWCHDLPKN